MRLRLTILLCALSTQLGLPEAAGAQRVAQTDADGAIVTRVWLDRGVDPVFQPGDRARVYYRASIDAYMVLFHIDTDGILTALFPGGTNGQSQVRGGRDYRLLFPNSDQWEVDEDPGVGYFFVLASTEPLDIDRLNRVQVAGGWASSPDRNRIEDDPYVVVDEFRQALMGRGSGGAGYAIDFTAYHVGQPYSYPRFLCYQCHTSEPFEEWNPYRQTCSEVRVVIYNDPYYYPATRYQGGRVLYPSPPQPGLPQFSLRARSVGEQGAPLVQSRVVIPSNDPASGARAEAREKGVPTGDLTGFPIPLGRDGDLRGLLRQLGPVSPLFRDSDPASNQPVVESTIPGRPGTVQSRPVLERRSPDDAPKQR